MSTYAIGEARSMRKCAYDGGGGQILVILVRTY